MEKENKIWLLILAEMTLISMLAISMPALLTTFQQEYNLSIAQSAVIPVLSMLGGFLTNLIAASVAAEAGLKRLNLSFLTIGLISVLMLAFAGNFTVFLTGCILVGVTTALGLSNTSTILAHLHISRQNYSLYHAFFGIGGILTPAIISFLLGNGINYRYVYYFLMTVYAFFILLILLTDLIENKKYEQLKLKEAFRVLKKRFVLPVIILLAFQAGNEQSIVTWSGNLLHDGFGISIQTASLYLSVYWIFFTFSRLTVHFVERKLGKLNTVKISTISLALCIILLICSGVPIFFITAAVFLAPGFPLMQKYSAQKLPPREIGLFNGVIFAFSSMGNVFLTGVMGWIGDLDIIYSYLVPIVTSLLILYILFYLTLLKKKGIVKRS